jgi:hypothetical protein
MSATGLRSGGCDDDEATVALERLESVAACAAADELRLLSAGRDVDHELNPERLREAQQCWEGRVVLAALEPRDGWLAHSQTPGERGLAESVLGAVGDHLHRDRAGKRRALPLATVLGIGVEVRNEHHLVSRQIGEVHDLGYIKLVMTATWPVLSHSARDGIDVSAIRRRLVLGRCRLRFASPRQLVRGYDKIESLGAAT